MSYVCPFFKSALLVEDHTLDASYFVEKDDSYYSFSLIQTYLTMVLLILTLYVASQFFKIGKPSILHQYSLSRLCASNTFIWWVMHIESSLNFDLITPNRSFSMLHPSFQFISYVMFCMIHSVEWYIFHMIILLDAFTFFLCFS